MSPAVDAVVTCILPVRNYHGPYLEAARASLDAQDDAGWDLVVVGEPGEVDALARYVDPAAVVTNEGRGLAGAINTGMRHARTSFVSLLLGDDLWAPTCVSVLRREIEANPEVDFFHSARQIIDDHGMPISSVHRSRPDVGLDDFLRGAPVKHLLCWRLAKAMEIGGLDETLNNIGPDDFDFPWTMAEHGARFRAIDECLYLYRDHRRAERLTTHIPRSIQRSELRRIMRKHGVPEREVGRRVRAASRTYLRQALFRTTVHRRLYERLGLQPRARRDRYR